MRYVIMLVAVVALCSGCELPVDNPFQQDAPDKEINIANSDGGTVVVQDGKGNTVEVLNMAEEPNSNSVRVTQNGEGNKVKVANVPPEPEE